MSKPSIPGELRGVDVQFVSLVSQAANGKKFQIFKSVDSVDGPEPQEEPKEKGLFQLLKGFFSGHQHQVEKGESGLFVGGNAAIIKAGRKISAARLAALKDAHGLLASIIAEAEDAQEGGTEVTREEIQAIVREAIDEALKPITERLEALEKGGDTKPEQEVEPITAEAVKGIVAEAIKGAIEPLASRLETVEKVRGLSNGLPSSGSEIQTRTVEKSVFGGAFIGRFSE